jgi:hypothetical protein
MIGATFLAAAIFLTLAAYGFRRVILGAIAAFAWMLLGLYAYSMSAATWDLAYGMFWFCIGAFLAIIVDMIWLMIQEQNKENVEERQNINFEKREDAIEKVADGDEDKGMNPIDRIRKKHGLKPSAARARREENKRLGWR